MNEKKEYWPIIQGGSITRLFRFGEYLAALVTDMQSPGLIEYLYVMLVTKILDDKLCLCIASEKDTTYGKKFADASFHSRGSHVLCVFTGDFHLNYGASNDWADIDLFTARALELARDQLNISGEAVEEV